jgi:hypothetical protein
MPLDACRERTLDTLAVGFSRGLISEEEYERRVERALGCSSEAELDKLVEELREAPQQAAPPHRKAYQGASDMPKIVTLMSTRAIDETGLAFPVTSSLTVMGELVLDLRGSTLPEVEIDLLCVMGSVRVFVSNDVYVENRVVPVMGESKVRGLRPSDRDSGRVLRLSGMVVMGELLVRAG